MILLVDISCGLLYNSKMELSSGVKFRCYPTEEQQKILSQWMGCQRFIYNSKVGEDRYFRTFRNHSLALTGIQTPVDQNTPSLKARNLPRFCMMSRPRFFGLVGG